jgi:hypothetical protein
LRCFLPAAGAITPVGVTSQIVGKFKDLDQCKAAAKTLPLFSGSTSICKHFF